MPGPRTRDPRTAEIAEHTPVWGTPPAYAIGIKHTFETAHRLPHLNGKCTSLHGHSWQATITVTAPELADAGTVVEYGALKAGVRAWIDTHLDHGTMLGSGDPLTEPLIAAGCKVFRFGRIPAPDGDPEGLASDLAWPTVEATAVLLWRTSLQILAGLPSAMGAAVGRVVVQETHLNTAIYGPVTEL